MVAELLSLRGESWGRWAEVMITPVWVVVWKRINTVGAL